MSEERVESVKRALRLLVVDPRAPATVDRSEAAVRRGEVAVEDVREAARFADADGFAELERAVAAAERHGRPDVAARGNAVLDAVDAYRATASDHFRHGHEGLMSSEPVLPEETT